MTIKRLFDLIFALGGIILLSPILVLIAIIIKLTSNGPIIFKQMRIGKDKKAFHILKFRTMVTNAEQLGPSLTVGNRDPRITPIGYYLRKTKLDELPQLFNVLKGEMSFVGPRPEVPKYVNLYTPQQLEVLSVKPGITDIASIKYRNENDILDTYNNPEKAYIEKIMPEKLQLNLQYIQHRSLWRDIWIILQTLQQIFRS